MKKILATVIVAMAATGVLAENKPIQLSITPDMALHDRNERIEGLSVGIWNENPQTALSIGIVNGSTGQSSGLSWAYILNYADDYKGIQWGPINYTKGSFFGLQSGVVNYAGHLKGLQLGLVNYAESAETGVQIGLLNLMPENEWFTALPNELAPGMVFANWRF